MHAPRDSAGQSRPSSGAPRSRRAPAPPQGLQESLLCSPRGPAGEPVAVDGVVAQLIGGAYCPGLVDTYPVRTYYVRMNVTLSIDEKLLARARELAHERGTSVNQLIRDYLERITGRSGPSNVMEQLERLWSEQSGRSGGWKWNREEVYDRPVLRRHERTRLRG